MPDSNAPLSTATTDDTDSVAVSRTPFIGRQQELQALQRRFDGGANLVTIVGPPGAGKTRLAREFGETRAEQTSANVYFCDLSSARDRGGALSTVAATVDVSTPDDGSADEFAARIGRALADRDETVLILDNVEHLIDTVDDPIGRWSRQAPEVELLVTSREQLGLAGEYCVELGPLDSDDAVDLFVRRARMAGRDLELDAPLQEQISELVDRLDRLPLAIELAASRVRTLPPAELLDRLSDRFRLLRSRDRLEDRESQTLEDAIAWSWELLEDHEQALLRQCTVFSGGFSLDAAEAVLEAPEDRWVVDLVETLVRKSLLFSDRPEDFPGRARFAMYESVREFVRKRVDGDLEETRRRHAEYFRQTGCQWAERLDGPDASEALAAMRLERSNLRRAFQWMAEHTPEQGVELGLALDRMLRVSEPLEAHRTVVDRTVELARQSSDQPRIARALLARTRHALLKGDLEGAAGDAQNALAAVEHLDDHAQLRGRARFRLGETMRQKGDADEGGRHLQRAADLAAETENRALERSVLAHLASCEIDVGHTEQAADYLESFDRKPQSENLRRECRAIKRAAYVHYFLGDYGEQRRLNSRALELARQLEDRNLEGLALQGLGDSSFASGDYEEAVEHYREALTLHRRLGNEHYAGVLQGNLATALHRLGHLDEARDCYNASLDTHRRTGARPYLATVSFAYGTLLFETDELEPARRKLEESADLYGAIEGKLEDLAATRLTLGLLDLVDGETEKAETEFQKATEQFDEAGSEGWTRLGTACETLARWHRGDEGSDTARDAFRAVEELESAPECRAIGRVLEAPLLVDTDGEQADDRVRGARSRDDDSDDLSLFEWSLYGRAATLAAERLVETIRSRADRDPTPETVPLDEADLVVGPEGRWFETDGETTDLRRRGSLRRILATLAERHGESPEALDVYDMFDVGWPDQEIEPDSAADRVYWAVRELRKAGLDEILQTTDEGYLLDPGAAVARSERSNPEE